MKSIEIWKNRYKNGGNSGHGSKGHYLDFKVNFINDFIKNNNITSILDFGCGDLDVAKKIDVQTYFGIDIIDYPTDITHNFISKNNKLITSMFDNINIDKKFDATICLDVLYHILKDENSYLIDTINNIINYSTHYIIIYAQDPQNPEVKNWINHMNNSDWLSIIEKNPLKLIYKQDKPIEGNSALFYIFEKL